MGYCMKIIQQVLMVLCFVLICSEAFAMGNNKPRPPSGIFGKRSSQKNMILLDVVKGRPEKLEDRIGPKEIAKEDNFEIAPQAQANLLAIEELSNATSRNNARNIDLIAGVFERINKGEKLNDEEMEGVINQMEETQLYNSEAYKQAHATLRKNSLN